MNNMVFKVEGMVCEKCTARIERVMGDTEGVKSVKCDIAEKTITLETTLDYDSAKENIEDMGFDVVE